jgi:hypothetical protein
VHTLVWVGTYGTLIHLPSTFNLDMQFVAFHVLQLRGCSLVVADKLNGYQVKESLTMFAAVVRHPGSDLHPCSKKLLAIELALRTYCVRHGRFQCKIVLVYLFSEAENFEHSLANDKRNEIM